MTLLALYSHGRRAGKDTAGEFIHEWCDEQGLSYQRLAFADKGKLLVAEALGMRGATDAETIDAVDEFKLNGYVEVTSLTNDLDETRIPGRDFIINLLGEIGASEPGGARRIFGERFWTDATLPEDWHPTADVTVITDLRSEEEAERVHTLGGNIVEIINLRAVERGNRSERGINDGYMDIFVGNSDSLDGYRQRVRRMVELLRA